LVKFYLSINCAIGDAVMAVFGVPFASNEDAIKSCNASLRMRDSLIISNKTRHELGKKTIKIGIGINTGMVSKLVKLPYS
jgi:adenylate cyclase